MSDWKEILKNESKDVRITFVCTGNIIRSAYSEFLAKKYFKSKSDKIIIFDSGACKHQNSYMYPLTQNLLLKEGYNQIQLEAFRPRLIEYYMNDFNKTTLFIAMTKEHLAYIEKNFPGKGFLLKDMVLGKKEDVLDPYYFPEKEIEIMKELKNLIKEFCRKLEELI